MYVILNVLGNIRKPAYAGNPKLINKQIRSYENLTPPKAGITRLIGLLCRERKQPTRRSKCILLRKWLSHKWETNIFSKSFPY